MWTKLQIIRLSPKVKYNSKAELLRNLATFTIVRCNVHNYDKNHDVITLQTLETKHIYVQDYPIQKPA